MNLMLTSFLTNYIENAMRLEKRESYNREGAVVMSN